MAQARFPDLQVSMVDEDPHWRRRTVPMKVLVLGYPRTGTSSIQKALEGLGFGPCYHMRNCINQNPRDCEMWVEALKAKYDGVGIFGSEQWDQLLGDFSSLCDLPAIACGAELMKAYPSAKIILTNRPVDDWYQSCDKTLRRARDYWLHSVLERIDWATALVHGMRRKLWQTMFADDFEKNGRAAMVAHYDEIRRLAKEQGREVLEFHLTDGWAPLCRFLEVDVPGYPYPRMNEGGDWILKMKHRARGRLWVALTKLFWGMLPVTVTGCGIMAVKVWNIQTNYWIPLLHRLNST
ncbi:MAG: hypothetical protein MMC33_000935 [Icmadophila ericetorum]|nr:hypothetical protein [Icmadophila ericetorum]